jgi:hypothetical protein
MREYDELPGRAMVLRGFVLSPEHSRLAPHERELVWVEQLLDAMGSAGWSWIDLDLETFEAVLLDGLCATIEDAPEDPARVARVLDAFLSYAWREFDAPHAPACCEYLCSEVALADIGRWVRPFRQPSLFQDSTSQDGSLSP